MNHRPGRMAASPSAIGACETWIVLLHGRSKSGISSVARVRNPSLVRLTLGRNSSPSVVLAGVPIHNPDTKKPPPTGVDDGLFREI